MSKSEMSAVWRIAAETMCEVQKWIRLHDKMETFYLTLKNEDKARIIRLRVWSQRFGVPVQEILDIVVQPLREQMDLKRRRRPYGLGFSVAILTGHTSERILSIIVGRRYPNGEQFSALREAERERQLDAEKIEDLEGLKPKEHILPSLPEAEDIGQFVEAYSKEVMAVRARNRTEGYAKWRRLKPYRGNPWR